MKIADVGNPGQDHDGLAVGHRKADGLAGLERHAVRDDAGIAEPFDDTVRKIAGALGRASREDHEIAFEAARERARQRALVVGNDAEMHGGAAKLLDRGADDRGVGVVDGARAQRIAGRDDLVARREDRHSRPAVDGDLAEPQRRQHADLARGEVRSGAKHRLASRDVRAGVAHVLAAGERTTDFEPLAAPGGDELRMLDHQHRVGAARQHSAGRDRRRDAGDHGLARHDTGREDFVVERTVRGVSSIAPNVSLACTAKPSTLERSKPGTSTSATTSSASTRLSAA